MYSCCPLLCYIQTDADGNPLSPSYLVCRCRAAELSGIKRCFLGRHVVIKSNYWAGNVKASNSTNQSTLDVGTVLDPEQKIHFVPFANESIDESFENSSLRLQVPSRKFVAVACKTGLCSHADWLYGKEPDCSSNGVGPLCGKCQKGTNLKLASPVSAGLAPLLRANI